MSINDLGVVNFVQSMSRTGLGNERQLLVSFSGIDGAGKSTQIAELRERLHEAGLRSVTIVFWEEVATLTDLRQFSSHTLFKGDEGVGSPLRPINRRDKNVKTWYMTLSRMGFYFLDALSLHWAVNKARNTAVDVIICDRYLFDELANLPLQSVFIRAYVRLLLKMTPRPDVAFLLDANPTEARERKPEYPVEFLHENRAAYQSLSEAVPEMIVIEPCPASQASDQIMRAIRERLNIASQFSLAS
jgi:thymidylate kinase